MILLLDNYDSFTFNLYQLLADLGANVEVIRNDQITIEEVESRLDEIEGIVISPGPGTPPDAGISVDLVKTLAGRVPILGVCLGHQSIGQAFGARIVVAPELRHGKTSQISHDGRSVYAGLPNPFTATRYHSLIIDPVSVPPEFEITARSEDGIIQGIRHKTLPVEGVQFHPESILTTAGKDLLRNFLTMCGILHRREDVVAVLGY